MRGGFSALVNYHRLCEGNGAGRRLLEKLRDSYLAEWVAAQRRALAAGEAGVEEHAAGHTAGAVCSRGPRGSVISDNSREMRPKCRKARPYLIGERAS